MHYFIYPNKDAYITENSPTHVKQYADSTSKNFGGDEILELKKEFTNSYATSSHNTSRILLQFDYSNVSTLVSDGTITNPRYYLRLYEVEGQSDLSDNYTVAAYPLSQSWIEGSGKKFDVPNITDGVSWLNSSTNNPWVMENLIGNPLTFGSNNNQFNVEYDTFGNVIASNVTFASYYSEFDSANHTFNTAASASGDFKESGSRSTGGGVWYMDDGFEASQSFINETPDIEMDVTDIVTKHINGTLPNNGLLLKFSGSYESDTSTPNLKFFSRDTHTIYSPKLEIRWDDSNYVNPLSTTLNYLTMSGELKNHIFIKGLQKSYRESEKVRFRIGCRKKYVQKTFTESMLTSSFYVPNGSGSYSIRDVATDTEIVPFSSYTSMSADTTSMYFDQYFNTFEPGRYYKILFKLRYNDGQEEIIDNNEEFKIV